MKRGNELLDLVNGPWGIACSISRLTGQVRNEADDGEKAMVSGQERKIQGEGVLNQITFLFQLVMRMLGVRYGSLINLVMTETSLPKDHVLDRRAGST